jgi:hypothetical protein
MKPYCQETANSAGFELQLSPLSITHDQAWHTSRGSFAEAVSRSDILAPKLHKTFTIPRFVAQMLRYGPVYDLSLSKAL